MSMALDNNIQLELEKFERALQMYSKNLKVLVAHTRGGKLDGEELPGLNKLEEVKDQLRRCVDWKQSIVCLMEAETLKAEVEEMYWMACILRAEVNGFIESEVKKTYNQSNKDPRVSNKRFLELRKDILDIHKKTSEYKEMLKHKMDYMQSVIITMTQINTTLKYKSGRDINVFNVNNEEYGVDPIS